MADIHHKMQQIKHHAEQHQVQQEQTEQQAHQKGALLTQQLRHLFDRIANNLVAGDSNLTVIRGETIGFDIYYIKFGQHNPSPFQVSATVNGSSVDIEISDGTWENIPNLTGAWGHWSDAKSMYSGKLNEVKISDVITRAFLGWYKISVQ